MNRFDSITSPGMIVSFICATFGLLSFASCVFTLTPDALAASAIIRLLLGSIYFLGALINIFKGVPHGNLNLIFSVCFGLFAGSNQIVAIFEQSLGLEVEGWIYGIVQIFAGCYLMAMLPVMGSLFAYQWFSNFFSATALLFVGASAVGAPSWTAAAGGWCFLMFALLCTYGGLSAIIPELPEGKTLYQMAPWLRKKVLGHPVEEDILMENEY